MKKRRPRPKTKHFNPSDPCKLWKPLLEQRDAGFDWGGSSTSDSYIDDVSSSVAKCILYKKALASLVEVANTGFPAHNNMEETLKMISKEFPVLQPGSKRVINDAIIAWRSMAKTLYELKKNGQVVEELKEIVERIVLPTQTELSHEVETPAQAKPPTSSASGQELSLEQVEKMFPEQACDTEDHEAFIVEDSGDEAVIQAVICNCTECQAKRSCTTAAASRLAVPSCMKGGQRKETEACASSSVGGKRFCRKTKVTGEGAKLSKSGKTKKSKSAVAKSVASTKRPAGALGERNVVAPPCKLVKRVKDCAAYILAKDKVYVASASDRLNGPKYLEGLEKLVEKIDTGHITSKAAAREFLQKFFQA